MKIVVLDAATVTRGDISLDFLKEYGEVQVYDLTAPDETADRIKDAHAVICNKVVLNESNLKDAQNLKYIGLFATGYNNIDIDYANSKGITVCNAGSYSTDAVAQHTFALILNHFSNVAQYDKFVKEGNWVNSKTFSPFVFPMEELSGKTLGLIGYGSIGKAVAKIAKAFNMRVLVYTRTPKNDYDVSFVDLDTLLKESDVISPHAPLNSQTKGMFNKESFTKMKKGAYFINTARGGVIEEQALFDALEMGHLSGAAIDVLEYEPMRENNILLKAKNITITPHVAWAPIETRRRLMGIVEDNLRGFINNTPQNVIK